MMKRFSKEENSEWIWNTELLIVGSNVCIECANAYATHIYLVNINQYWQYWTCMMNRLMSRGRWRMDTCKAYIRHMI